MLLTIGMMVKNEEKHLRECLESLQPILNNLDSELVIIDTGSTDNTVNIAKEYTEKLYFHQWNNDFSEMRNLTISYSKGDWFFVVDGDEVLNNADEIIEFFKSGEYKKYNSASMLLKNYLSNKDVSRYGMCDTLRFFKNDGTFQYTGTVHNQPIYKEPTKKILSMLEHYGYISDDTELMEKKFQRTATMLKKELEKDPHNTYYRYQLGVSYNMHGDFVEALEEISTAYSQLNEENRNNHKYILNEYANILMRNHKFKQCEELCLNELKSIYSDDKLNIDLLYFLAKSQFIQGDYCNSIINYKKYLEYMDKFEKGLLQLDLCVLVLASSNRYVAYSDIAVIEYSNKKYELVIDYINNIEQIDNIQPLFKIIINSFVKMKDFDGLINFYESKIICSDEKIIKSFQLELEDMMLILKDKETVERIETLFSNSNEASLYEYLNKLRCSLSNSNREKMYHGFIESIDLNNELSCYGDLIYIGIKNNYNVIKFIDKLKYEKLIEFLDYCDKKYKDCSEVLHKFIQSNNLYEDRFTENRVKAVICKALLILDKLTDYEYNSIFKMYLENGIELIKKVYSKYVLDNEKIFEVKDDEHRFMLYMYNAALCKETNEKDYIMYLKNALKVYPIMNKGVKFLLEELKKGNNNELNLLKDKLLNNVNTLIKDNLIEEALQVILEYEKIAGSDFNSLFYKSLILKLSRIGK